MLLVKNGVIVISLVVKYAYGWVKLPHKILLDALVIVILTQRHCMLDCAIMWYAAVYET